MNSRFRPDPSKLNPKFEGYKLNPFPDTHLFRTPLHFQPFRPSSHRRLGFRDLQARIRHSSLAYGHALDKDRGTTFMIDEDFHVHMIVFNKITKQTSIHVISQLIQPMGPIPSFTEPDRSVPLDPQPPSIIALSRDLLLASNGVGDIELIGIQESEGKFTGVSLATVAYEGTGTEGVSPVPCVLLTARYQHHGRIRFVLYAPSQQQQQQQQKTVFHIVMLEMDLPTLDHQTIHPTVLYVLSGSEVPAYTALTATGRLVLGSETQFRNIAHHNNNAEQQEQNQSDAMHVDAPAYQWSQEGPDITVIFTLPPNTPKSSIHCTFVRDHLSLLVDNQVSYPYRKLWSTVKPDDCLWTFEDTTLTLFMAKGDENTRWPQLFDHDDGVLETLTPLRLEEIKRHLSKFTAEVDQQLTPATTTAEGMMTPPPPAQHPAATDMDEDIDEEGQPLLVAVFDDQGQVTDETDSRMSWLCSAFIDQQQHDNAYLMPSIALQSDVDGLVFQLTEQEGGKLEMDHVATLDAFAFVQASKRDARFSHHDARGQFSAIVESNRNAYIYYHDGPDLVKKQTLVDLTRGEGEVLGVQLVLPGILMVMTETEVIVMILV